MSEDGLTLRLGWVDDPASDLPLTPEQRARNVQEAAAEARAAEIARIEKETADDLRLERLRNEARQAGRSEPGRTKDELRAAALKQAKYEDDKEARAQGRAVAVESDVPQPPEPRPPELQTVRERQARQLGDDVGKVLPKLGGVIAAFLGKRRR
jgi:hypothetical protein